MHDKFRLAFPISSNRLSPLSYISVSSLGINVHRIDGTRNHRQTDKQRVKLGIGIEILEYWKKQLNRRQRVFNVVLLINLCSPGRECHSERTLAVATLRKAKEAPTFVTANKISRLVYTHRPKSFGQGTYPNFPVFVFQPYFVGRVSFSFKYTV